MFNRIEILKTEIRNPEIRLIAVLAILLALSVAMIGFNIADENKLRAEAEHLGLANSIAYHLNLSAALQAQVRGLGATLIGSHFQSQEIRDQFIALSKQCDKEEALALQQGERLFLETGDSVLQKSLVGFKKIHEELHLFRGKLLEQDVALEEWMAVATKNIEEAYRLRKVVFTPTTQHEALLLYNNVIRANAATLTDYAGRERALLGYHIATGKPLDEQMLKLLESYRAVVDVLSNEVLLIKNLLTTPDILVQAISTYESKFLGEYQKLREEIYQQNDLFWEAEKSLVAKQALEADAIERGVRAIFNEFRAVNAKYVTTQFSKALAVKDPVEIMKSQKAVEDYFAELAEKNKYFAQLRFLDATGQERVRVETNKGQVKRVAAAALKDKAEKSYFKKTIAQQPGSIYVSPLDLNMEWDKIERPFKPTMRLASPIYYGGKARGIVIADFDPIGKVLYEGGIEKNHLLPHFLVNKEGFFLSHHDEEKAWGMMPQLNRSHFNIKNDLPELSREILSGREGVAINSSGLVYIWHPIHFNALNRENYWVLVTAIDGVKYSVNSSEWFSRATEGIQSATALSETVGMLSAKAATDIKENSANSIAIQYFMLVLAILSFGFIAIMVRVSQQTARKLQKSKDEAEKANKAKSDFLSSMSHELRTPMNAIMGFSQLLLSDSDEPLTEGQKGGVTYILNAGQHLTQLVNQVLELSKIEAGKVDVVLEDVELQLVIYDAISTTQSMADRHGIKIKYLDAHSECCIVADAMRIKQVLINLISNAVKYNQQNGSVVISCAPQDSGKLRITVSDTGIGIADDKLDLLYSPFDRLGAEKSNIEGSGIGLTITKRLVELMGGEISVESRLGVGSSFHVDMPLSIQAASRYGQQSCDSIRYVTTDDSCSIVYVEDNLANVELMRCIIKQHTDMAFCHAATGRDGVELVKRRLPNLVLLDIDLPDLDGDAVFEVLKNDPATANIPIIAVSAKALAHDIEAGLKIGFVDYITKPINVAHFIEVVDKVINRPG